MHRPNTEPLLFPDYIGTILLLWRCGIHVPRQIRLAGIAPIDIGGFTECCCWSIVWEEGEWLWDARHVPSLSVRISQKVFRLGENLALIVHEIGSFGNGLERKQTIPGIRDLRLANVKQRVGQWRRRFIVRQSVAKEPCHTGGNDYSYHCRIQHPRCHANTNRNRQKRATNQQAGLPGSTRRSDLFNKAATFFMIGITDDSGCATLYGSAPCASFRERYCTTTTSARHHGRQVPPLNRLAM
mmetsp:Transcript_12323/g.22364  ORF Transcript_12323/g.22364 Transcript_12323/m.22364 type:complete len:241 (-) Transcript_12323:298-1020(-)